MFERSESGAQAASVSITFDGDRLQVPSGISVAAALLVHTNKLRTTQGRATTRGPYCMMGVCFDCLVTIDGRESQRACMAEVADGMEIKRQQRAPDPASDAEAG